MTNSNSKLHKQALQTRYNTSRGNLLLVVAFTVINIILLITKSDTYFLFSAFIPYLLVTTGMTLCGMFSEELSVEELLGVQPFSKSVFAVLLVIALILVALYFISWIFSKKPRAGWLIFALVFFSVDTLAMLLFNGFALDGIIDIVFHIWVIISLSLGINAGIKLKKMPIEEVETFETEAMEEANELSENSQIIRMADLDVKSRVLIEAEVMGYAVIYRRVKRVNELVINGNVYDEIEMLVETAHSLKATINGHLIEVGYNGAIHSYLKLDGEIVAKKVRLY